MFLRQVRESKENLRGERGERSRKQKDNSKVWKVTQQSTLRGAGSGLSS